MTEPRLVHRLEFGDRTEAAAFLAALSRFLASPRGNSLRSDNAPAVVWALPDGSALLLSASAAAAVTAAFAPVPSSATISGAPPDARVVLDGNRGEALGVLEAERRLTGAAAGKR